MQKTPIFLILLASILSTSAYFKTLDSDVDFDRLRQAALTSDYALRQTAYLCNNIGPRGPAVIEFSFSAYGMPDAVVSFFFGVSMVYWFCV